MSTPTPTIESLYVSIDTAKTGTEPPQDGKHLGWGKWHRVADADGSTIAYCPDSVTARLIAQAPAMREALREAADVIGFLSEYVDEQQSGPVTTQSENIEQYLTRLDALLAQIEGTP